MTTSDRPYNRPSEQLRGFLVSTDRRQWSVDRMNKALDLAFQQGLERGVHPSHAFPHCLVCNAAVDDPEATDSCEPPV